MNKFVPFLGLGTAAVLLGFVALVSRPATAGGADDDALWKPFLTADDFNKLVENEVKTIHEELNRPKVDSKKIKGAAILIALAAQDTKDATDPKQAATIRDKALKLFAAAEKSKDAKTLADSLSDLKQLKPDPQAKTEPADWRKQIEDLKDSMDIFGLPSKGGEGLERDLITLGQQRKPFSPAQMSDKVVMLAYKSALIAEVAKAHQDQGEKKKKDWLRLSDDMRRYSLELAETAKAKKPKETKTALNKLNTSCNDCHTTFRDK